MSHLNEHSQVHGDGSSDHFERIDLLDLRSLS